MRRSVADDASARFGRKPLKRNGPALPGGGYPASYPTSGPISGAKMTADEFAHVGRTRRLPVGAEVRVIDMAGTFTVAGQDDAALITLRSSRGLVLRVGRLQIDFGGRNGD